MPSLPKVLRRLVSPSQLGNIWSKLKNVPGGGRLLGELIGRVAPYTGTIKPEIVELEPGRSRVKMKDRRAVRNHLNSVHAIALMNLGEVATGTAVLGALPPDSRAIITHLEIDYLKKARGTITATCETPVRSTVEKADLTLHGELANDAGEVVARVKAIWRVGPAAT
jgi:acyl-coenzyme A thioesterase PaaI-like protein